ncbi:MAG: 37S ribosomal protein, mitochondrial [Pleopsidium flavum]|nr:MAG: 37S ribosomal protein, mitochondrial [Pleopsidium flavum]
MPVGTMIIRQLVCRSGRGILAAPISRTWLRALTAQVDNLNALDNGAQEMHSIETQTAHRFSNDDLPIDAKAQATAKMDTLAGSYHAINRQRNTNGQLGTTLAPHYQPHTLLTHPPSPRDITVELLLASQSHMGHSTSLWNPANSRYIFGIRQGIHIISLDVTAAHLRRACKIVSGVTERGGLILFVGTRSGQERCVVNAARLAGGCHLFERWVPGSITNGQQILGQCRLKVVDEFDRELQGFGEQLVDRAALKPDLVVCLNPLENYVLLHECGLNNIPTIGIIDTDANPTWVTYPIPANDDSMRCVQVIAGVLGRAGEEGQKRRRDDAERGVVTSTPTAGLKQPGTQGTEVSDRAASPNL